jgi:PAS domain S-box-containing protein
MNEDLHEVFNLAAKYFFKKYRDKGGSQAKLAQKLKVTQPYISSVLTGSKNASLDLQSQVASVLYHGPFEEFLAIGRRIKNGLAPEIHLQKETNDSVESLITRLSHYVVDHQRIEKELVESNMKLQDIILTGSDMVFEMDRNLRFTFLAGKTKEATGRSEKEMLGQNPLEYMDDNEKTKLRVLIDKSIHDHSIMKTIVSLTMNNEKKYTQLTAKPVYDEKGEFVGFRGSYRDITEEVQAKEKLEYESWLMSETMESTDWVGLVLLDKDKKIIKYNSVYKRMFAIPEEILQENNPLKNINWIKSLMLKPDYFMKKSSIIFKKNEKFTHEFDLVDGRRIRRVVLPLFKNDELAGRHVIFYDITPKA